MAMLKRLSASLMIVGMAAAAAYTLHAQAAKPQAPAARAATAAPAPAQGPRPEQFTKHINKKPSRKLTGRDY